MGMLLVVSCHLGKFPTLKRGHVHMGRQVIKPDGKFQQCEPELACEWGTKQ